RFAHLRVRDQPGHATRVAALFQPEGCRGLFRPAPGLPPPPEARSFMTRAAIWLLSAGVLLFAAVLISQGLTAAFATLAVAGWGLLLLALLHLVPLALDGASIRVMLDRTQAHSTLRDSLLARWVGESANSFLPAGPIGGPVMMVRYLAQRGLSMRA